MGVRESGGRRRLGWLRPTAVRRGIPSILVLSCLALAAGPSASASVTPPSCDQAPYDIDGNSQIEALTDGLLLLRYFFGFREGVLIAGVVGQNCTRCTAPLIEEFIVLALAGCPACGDGVADPGEECDVDDLGGADCSSFGFSSGTLACTIDCTIDVSACTNCGNGVIDSPEQCDINDFGGVSCISFGFLGGNLACTADCTIDASDCTS